MSASPSKAHIGGRKWVCVAQMLAQQNTKPAEGPPVHHLEGVP
jgi:hypothetical protein